MIRDWAPLRVLLDNLGVLHTIMENMNNEEGRNGTSGHSMDSNFICVFCGDSTIGLFISVINQLDAQNFCFTIRAHHQKVKIALHGLWYHHTYRWPSRAQVH